MTTRHGGMVAGLPPHGLNGGPHTPTHHKMKPVDDDPLCACNHMDAAPSHTQSIHTPGCSGLDSYGMPCECRTFELSDVYQYDDM